MTDSGTPAPSSTTTVTVRLADMNDALVLDNTGAAALTPVRQLRLSNPGMLVSDLFASAGGNRVIDQDVGAVEGIAIVTADTAHGSWQFSTGGGTTWTALGTVSNGSARLLAANATTRIRFVSTLLYTGTVETELTFRAWDQTSGFNGGLASTAVNGGTSAFSAATETGSVTVRLL